MKKQLVIITIVLLIFILILTPGCIKQKSYTIRVTTINWEKVFVKEEGATRDYLIKQNTSTRTYKAKEVISFNETSVRFIDDTGKEQFISADKIEVMQQ